MWLLRFVILGVLVVGGMSQAEAPEEAPLFDEDIEEDARAAAVEAILSRYDDPLTLTLQPGIAGVLVFEIPRNESVYPDVLITLSGIFPVTNTDLYCKPGGTADQLEIRDIPHASDYEWKSDHLHGRDYVFISRHHYAFEEVVLETAEGIEVALFVCTMYERSFSSTLVSLEVDIDYESRELVEEEQEALQSIFDECCQEDGQCVRWKQHRRRNNTGPNDFCHFEGSICNADGHLVRLGLDVMNMSCRFPAEEILTFRFLEKLDMRGDPIRGRTQRILETALELENLYHLALSEADLRGDLARDPSDEDSAVCRLARSGTFRDLDMEDCGITGVLPDCLFDRDSRLRAIHLGNNQLTGELPRIDMTNSTLVHIFLHGNQLTGELPSEWTTFTNLRWMDLSLNQLSGELPRGLGFMESLETFWVGGNYFEGSFPRDLAHARTLRQLNVSHNLLSGELPESFENNTGMLFLTLGSNQFTGPIPRGLANATGLVILDLSDNQFSGEVPEEIGMLRSLSVLRLDNNNLTGRLPATFGRLENMLYLFMNSNRFTGRIPNDWVFMSALRILSLYDNELEGMIPGWMWETSFLPVPLLSIDLRGNQLTGFDDTWYGNTSAPSHILEFYAADNRIQGEFPRNLARQITLRGLDLSGNEMSGPLPSAQGDLLNVLSLNLSSNGFTGEIPETWASIALFISDRTTVMNLTYNQLTGRIPSFMLRDRGSTAEREFYLEGNGFEYECPLSNRLGFVQDLVCNGTDEGTVVQPSFRTEVPDEESTVATFDAGEGVTNQNTGEGTEMSSDSSSSSELVPVLASLVAVCFAVGVVIFAVVIRRSKSRKVNNSQSTIPMSMIAGTSNTMSPKSGDKIHMLHGVDSSGQV